MLKTEETTPDGPSQKRQRTRTAVKSTSTVLSISTVWQHIEPYLFLDETIATSKVCKELHNLIIEQTDQSGVPLVKVTHFCEINKKQSSYAKHLTKSVECIHYPSLKRLRFPPSCLQTTSDTSEDSSIERVIDGLTYGIVIFIAQMTNLEELWLGTSGIIKDEHQWSQHLQCQMYGICKMLSRHLLNCNKLKSLSLINHWAEDNNELDATRRYYSVALLEAVTPMLKARQDGMEKINIQIAGNPTSPRLEKLNDCQILKEYFAAVLLASELNHLDIRIYGNPIVANALLQAANDVGVVDHPRMENLILDISSNKFNRVGLRPILPLYKCFVNSHTLTGLGLHIPRGFWSERESLNTFKQLVVDKMKLIHIRYVFDDYKDHDKKVLGVLAGCITNYSKIDDFWITTLRNASVKHLQKLRKVLRGKRLRGFHCCDDLDYCDEETIYVDSFHFQ